MMQEDEEEGQTTDILRLFFPCIPSLSASRCLKAHFPTAAGDLYINLYGYLNSLKSGQKSIRSGPRGLMSRMRLSQMREIIHRILA